MTRRDRLAGVLLGTALGDALGLPAEGMSAAAIRRRFGRVERFRLLGATGFVSDDTEQAALVAEALARHPGDPAACAAAFRRALVRWFLRLPFGVGLATVRASCRALAGRSPTGVRSAGNGALMRAPVLGVALPPGVRTAFGLRLAEVTHLDPRAVEGALYVAEVAAAAADGIPPQEACAAACEALAEPTVRDAVRAALARAGTEADPEAAGRALGNTGYAPHTAALATWAFARCGDEPLTALATAIAAGGDTDTTAAVVGAWLGARHGEAGLPADLLARVHDGPFGPTHLRALAAAVADGTAPPAYSAAAALGRNLALYPVVLAHGLRRLLP